MKKVLLLAASILILAVSCSSSKKDEPYRHMLRGMLYDYDNKPLDMYELTIPELKRTVYTDITGRFDFGFVESGSYTITGHRTGYEDIYEQFTFSDSRQILYIRTASAGQLLSKAAECIEKNRTEEARGYIERCEMFGEDDNSVLFYKALLDLQTGDINNALRTLKRLEKNDYSESAVPLFIADIYEYEKKDAANAAKYLKKAHKLTGDDKLLARIERLEKEAEKEESDE